MFHNLIAILSEVSAILSEGDEEFKFHVSNSLIEVIQTSKNKAIRQNGFGALAIFYEKLGEYHTIPEKACDKTRDFLIDMILFDKDDDNLINSLKCLRWLGGKRDWISNKVLVSNGFLKKIVSLMKFFLNFKNLI